MTTLQAISSRVTSATARPGVHEIDPILIVALMQAITQVVIACLPQPEDAAKYLAMDDLRGRPILRAIRRRKINAAIRKEAARLKVSRVRVPEIVEAVQSECARATPDVVADLFADVRAAKGDS